MVNETVFAALSRLLCVLCVDRCSTGSKKVNKNSVASKVNAKTKEVAEKEEVVH
jgi:hypothetical protein